MLSFLNKFLYLYSWYIMGAFDKIWNKYNKYEISKSF